MPFLIPPPVLEELRPCVCKVDFPAHLISNPRYKRHRGLSDDRFWLITFQITVIIPYIPSCISSRFVYKFEDPLLL